MCLIVPTWKRKGDVNDPGKYSGITLLSQVLKLLERGFEVFCVNSLRCVHWFPASTASVVSFTSSLFIHNYAASTIASTLSAISFFHKMHGFSDPTASFVVKKLLQGAAKLRPSRDILDARIRRIVEGDFGGRPARFQEGERNSRRDVRPETDGREETEGTGQYGSGVRRPRELLTQYPETVAYPELVSRGVSKSRKCKWLEKVGASNGVAP